MGCIDDICFFILVNIVVFMVSDICSLFEDKSGDMLVKCIEEVGYIVVECKVLCDECVEIVD